MTDTAHKIVEATARKMAALNFEPDSEPFDLSVAENIASLSVLADAVATLEAIAEHTKRVRGKSKAQAYDDGVACDGVNHFIDLQEIDDTARECLARMQEAASK